MEQHPLFWRAVVLEFVPDPAEEEEAFDIVDGPDYPLAYLLKLAERRDKAAAKSGKPTPARRCAATVFGTSKPVQRCGSPARRDSDYCRRHQPTTTARTTTPTAPVPLKVYRDGA